MAIKKQEFYEGAALHLLARAGTVNSLRYEAPLFVFNGAIRVLLKYSTKVRSPWGFTFMPDEQRRLLLAASSGPTFVGLVCGSDGVAAFDYAAFASIAVVREGALHIACYRSHGEFYEINGPDGTLERKVPPSSWQRILNA